MQIPFHAFISRNKDFGIMLPRFYLKYAVFEFKMSSWVKSDHPHLNKLEKTYLEPKFHMPNLKNKNSGQQSGYQKIWKILL